MHHSRQLRGKPLDVPVQRMKCAGKVCSESGCDRPAEKKLLCRRHYERRERLDLGTCESPGCANRQKGGRRGLCDKHYLAQYRSTNPKLCSRCARPSIAKGMCAAHYSRAKRGHDQSRPLVPRYNGSLCSVSGCLGQARGLGLCKFHYSRKREGVPLDAPPRAPTLKSYINSWGYVQTVCPDGRHRVAHRLVMEEMLGRELTKEESVHHKNAVRTDNRPENLELWTRYQPRGARVVDKVAWAREILALYGHLFPET